MSIDSPSRFWTKLGAQHAEDLERFGFETLKRHQALKYFTWRWQWDMMLKSEQLRFLLTHTTPLTWIRAAGTPAVLDDGAWEGMTWPRRNRWLYTFATRVLWEYAGRHDASSTRLLPEPTVGHPLPVYWRGRLISQDLSNTALEVSAMVRALGGSVPGEILEVGAGYGRTAHALLNLYPNARYTIIDVEPAIDLSKWYLRQLFPEERLRFLSPSEAQGADLHADLALSISSLHEMTPAQVAEYLTMFDAVAAGGVVYLKQWTDWYNPDDEVRMRFADYPFPDRWRGCFFEAAPVQTTFTQAAWRVPPPGR